MPSRSQAHSPAKPGSSQTTRFVLPGLEVASETGGLGEGLVRVGKDQGLHGNRGADHAVPHWGEEGEELLQLGVTELNRAIAVTGGEH